MWHDHKSHMGSPCRSVFQWSLFSRPGESVTWQNIFLDLRKFSGFKERFLDCKLFSIFREIYLSIYELNKDLKLFSRFDNLFKSDLSKR